MPISTLLFDVGGVLIAPLDATAVARRRDRLAAELGFPDGESMWQRFYTGWEWRAAKTGAMTEAEMWQALLAPHGLTTAVTRDTFVARLFEGEGVLDGMRALLEALHGRYRLAILSNASDILEARLDQFDLTHYFDPIVNSHRIGVAKPDTAAFDIALARAGAPAAGIYFIDNMQRNTLAAQALGMTTHLFTAVDGLRADLAVRGLL